MGYHMPTYDIALVVSIPADSYEEALQAADQLAAGIGMTEELSVSAVLTYEHSDGQRVVYLHNENEHHPSRQVETP